MADSFIRLGGSKVLSDLDTASGVNTIRVSFGGTGTSATAVQGNVAHDAADAGSPIKTGGYASATFPSAVAAGDRVNQWFGLAGDAKVGLVDSNTGSILTWSLGNGSDTPGSANGPWVYSRNSVWDAETANWRRTPGNANGLVVQPFAVSASRWQYAGATGGITDTGDVAIAAAAGAATSNYVTAIQFLNTSAVASEIVIKDGSTVIWRGMAPAAMAQMASIVFPTPLRGTANTAMNVAMGTTATATRVSAQGYTGL